MPLWQVLHKADALALRGAGDDYDRASVNLICEIESVQDCGHIVPVNLDYMSAESSPLIGNRLCRHYMLRSSGLLNAVTVDDDCEVVQAELGSQ